MAHGNTKWGGGPPLPPPPPLLTLSPPPLFPPRPDVLPPAVMNELAKLQDKIEPFDTVDAVSRLPFTTMTCYIYQYVVILQGLACMHACMHAREELAKLQDKIELEPE